MSDFRVYIYDCPADERGAAEALLIDEHRLSLNWGDGDPRPLDLVQPYTADDPPGDIEHFAQVLAEVAPGASFVMWDEPDTNGSGVIAARTPALGMFTGICDPSGDPVLTLSDITEITRTASAGISAHAGGKMLRSVTGALDRAAGGPWFRDWQEHEAD